MSDNPYLIEEKNIPESWIPVDTVPGKAPSGAPAPPVPHDMPQYFSGSLPPVLQHDSRFIATEVASPRIPKTALMPFGPQSNPFQNAAATSTAKIIAQQVVAATPPVASDSTAVDTDIISGTNKQPFGSFDSSSSKTDNSGSVSSISTTTLAATANELAVVIGVCRANAVTLPGLTPGVGWTDLAAGGAWQKIIPAAGSLTVTQGFSSTGLVAAQALAVFKTNGGTPVFTQHGTGSGGSTLTSSTWTPTAGNSIMFLSTTGEGDTTPFAPTISDTQGNVYVLIQSPFNFIDQGGGIFKSAQCVMFYAQNVKGASTTLTIKTNNASKVFGDWKVYEVSNVGNIASGSYTFQSSDTTKLIQFTGGANVTGTLPSPAFAAGWQVVVSNNSAGTLTLVPASGTFLNGSTAGVVIPSGGSTWIFSDGTNYSCSTTALPLSTALIANQWLSSYNPITGAFGQTQPDFTNISGQASNAQLPTAISVITVGASNGFATGTNLVTDGNGAMTSYNGRTTAGAGLTTIEGTVDTTTNGANIASTTLYAVPGVAKYATTYRISFYLSVTRAATTSSTLPDIQFTATDPDTTTVITYGPFVAVTPTGNSLTTVYSGEVTVRAKQGTNITYQVGNATQFASAGATSMQYSVHLRAESL